MGRAVAATSRGALSARACLPDTGACILSIAWNCGLGRKWLEPDKVPLMATIPAADHTAAPAMAMPKEAIDSGRNRGRSDCIGTILLNNTNQAGKSRKCPQVGERPQVRDVRIVPFLTSDLRTMQKYG